MNKKQVKNLTVVGKVFSAVSDVLTILSYLGLTLSVIAGIIKKSLICVIPFVISIIILIIICFCKKNNTAIIKYILKIFAYNMQYTFDEWTTEYEYHTIDKMSFSTSYLVRAQQTGVDNIRVKFNWSGATDLNPINPQPICKGDFQSNRIELFAREYGYNHYKLYSKHSINKGDTPIKMGVKLSNLVDTERKASSHILTSISVDTKKLTMIAIFPTTMPIKNIRCLEYLHSTDDFHWHNLSDEHKIELSGSKQYLIWSVDKPVYGGKYIMSWEFADSVNNNS